MKIKFKPYPFNFSIEGLSVRYEMRLWNAVIIALILGLLKARFGL
jgi:hypothetical protein